MIDLKSPLPKIVWITSKGRVATGAAPMKVYPCGLTNASSVFYARPASNKRVCLYTNNEAFYTKEEADAAALKYVEWIEVSARRALAKTISRMEAARNAIRNAA